MRDIKICLGLLCCVLLCACDRGEEMPTEPHHTDVFKVAVVAPTHLLPYWERTAAWEIGRAHV